jgi:hypothetical protein
MRRWLGVAAVLFLLSCSTLRDDPSIPATSADFYTAEAVLNGERFRGVKIVSVEKGQSLASLDLKIQGLFSGTVKIDSENCFLNESVRYEKSSLVKVHLRGEAEQSCVISYVVSPQYPRQTSQAVVVHSFKGAVAIKVREQGEPWIGRSVVMPVGSKALLELDLREENPVRVIFSGCGVEYSARLHPEEGWVNVPVEDFVSENQGLCVASGLVLSTEYEDLFLDVLVVRHDPNFVDLPKPAVEFKGEEVCVSADPVVSFLMTDSGETNCTEKCFKSPKYIRGVTVKGRSFVGEVKDGSIEWK